MRSIRTLVIPLNSQLRYNFPMTKTPYYIYRNLTSSCFSVKFRGKVIERFTAPIVLLGEFKVNQNGRLRVISEKKKYVHAFVKSVYYPSATPYIEKDWAGFTKREVVYNPYKNTEFVFADTGESANGCIVVLEYPKVYCLVGSHE